MRGIGYKLHCRRKVTDRLVTSIRNCEKIQHCLLSFLRLRDIIVVAREKIGMPEISGLIITVTSGREK